MLRLGCAQQFHAQPSDSTGAAVGSDERAIKTLSLKGDIIMPQLGNAARGSDKTERQTHITQQMEIQERHISRFTDLIATLEKRLNPLLGAAPPDDEKVTGDEAVLVPLANDLRGNNDSINRSIYLLDSILNRLEL